MITLFLQSHASYTKTFLSTDLRLLLSAILNSKDGVVVAFGLVCSTFITISRGSTFRHYFLPEGDPHSLSVSQSNLLAARTNGLKLWIYSLKTEKGHIYIYMCVFILNAQPWTLIFFLGSRAGVPQKDPKIGARTHWKKRKPLLGRSPTEYFNGHTKRLNLFPFP